ncbi:MAG: hypothetical protein JWN17_1430 [Frankiales bacterium]|nr:hypothetical protein [Frankiales bacterium]
MTSPSHRATAPGGGLRAALGGTVGASLWVLLVLALIVASVVLGLRLRTAERASDARAAALQAARQEAVNLTSVDGKDIQGDLKSVLAGASGQFRQDFQAQSSRLSSVLEDNQVTAEGKVLDAGLSRFDGDTATAVVVVDTQVANKAIPKGQVRHYRMQLDLERTGDRWLTNTLQFVN